jgi:hypothetical protein|uniref:Uncharacterized protein n=1 Tax=Podoviridae sp. ctz6O13 TaxID=2827757 RepID=A0A8S5TK66_9CAUD|nr:MAG TPA: hypothetical protein [Podoviridae sp. ctz6O13]
MKLDFCIQDLTGGKIRIKETTGPKQYLPEDSNLTAKYRFKYSDTVVLAILTRKSFNEKKDKCLSPIVSLKTSVSTVLDVVLPADGWYHVSYVVLPTKDWITRELRKRSSILHVYDYAYYADKGNIWVYSAGKSKPSSLPELLGEKRPSTTISRKDMDYVSISNLYDYSNGLYLDIFNSRLKYGYCPIDACEANRVSAILNLVKHYIRGNQYAEAGRILEKIGKPSKDSKMMPAITNGCGCS